MVAIQFPSSTSPGRNPQESAGRLINAYSEPTAEGGQLWRRVPGLESFSAPVDPLSVSGFRGQLLVNTVLYAAYNNRLVYVDSAGLMTDIAALTGSAPVTAARNNRTPTPQAVFVVPGTGAYSVTTTTVTQIVDPDLPAPQSVCFIDGFFFLAIADGRCFASGLNDITVDALHVTTAEAKPDTLVRGVAHNRELFLMGTTSTEVYTNEGNATGFPFGRVAVIPRGLASLRAVTGFEDGFDMGLLWVGNDNHVHRLEGYAETIISPPDLAASFIEHVVDKSAIEMQSYMAGGHAFSTVSGPTFTWVYDWTADTWHERESYGLDRWRGTGNTASAFGKWLVGDTGSGALLEVTDLAAKEVGEPLVWTLESGPNSAFPSPMRVGPAFFNFVSGVGDAGGADVTEVDPRVLISWSDDGGTSWSNPVERVLGQQGIANQQVEVRRTGRATPKGRRWRLAVSDPQFVSFSGGEMDVIPRRA